jgi:hypothetical protein
VTVWALRPLDNTGVAVTDKQTRATNWTRMLLWAWLVLSVIWIGGWIVVLLTNGVRGDLGEQEALVAWVLGPPLVAFFVGGFLNVARRWIIKGFKTKDR